MIEVNYEQHTVAQQQPLRAWLDAMGWMRARCESCHM